ncbi:MAG TPA: hypothetical protein VJX71_09815 [Methylomirabilota bacterium]|nr:hypothetical protein [Methylomirabilota bacterium]
MPKYRKRPVEVDAIRWENIAECRRALRALGCPDLIQAGEDHVYIRTPEGDMLAAPGDWIIKGVAGEFYPCKPEIFAKTYEEV